MFYLFLFFMAFIQSSSRQLFAAETDIVSMDTHLVGDCYLRSDDYHAVVNSAREVIAGIESLVREGVRTDDDWARGLMYRQALSRPLFQAVILQNADLNQQFSQLVNNIATFNGNLQLLADTAAARPS